jgi:hypothetical protein
MGENELAYNNHCLELLVKRNPKNWNNNEAIEVTFRYKSNGILGLLPFVYPTGNR